MGEVVMISEEEMELVTEIEELKKNKGSPEVVRWNKYLPRIALSVLLVEPDDSTRQIIAALLRKCNYKVAAVSDGLEAWETLKGKPNNIDLVLTEVDLPSISGFALLTLIMEDDICKNIPVIMMSSQDSIGMVLKFMLKGAADFLIKPIRKNELRNLWQHVWRRHTHKVEAAPDNNTESNRSSSYAISTEKDKECDDRSDAQIRTMPQLEGESPYMSNIQGVSQINFPSKLNNTNVEKMEEHLKFEKESVLQDNTNEGGYNSASLSLKENYACAETMINVNGGGPENKQAICKIGTEICSDNELLESSSRVVDLIGRFHSDPECSYGTSVSFDESNKFELKPQLELSLRRFCPSISNNKGTEETHTLNHSTASAFLWYHNSKTLQPLFPTSPSTTESKEPTSTSPGLLPNTLSEDISFILGKSPDSLTTLVMGQSGQAEQAFPDPELGLIPISGVRLDNVYAGFGPGFPPVLYTQLGLVPTWSSKPGSQLEQSFPTSSLMHFNPETHNSEQDYSQSDETDEKFTDHTVDEQMKFVPEEELRHGSPVAGQSASSGSLCYGAASHITSTAYGSISSRNDVTATTTVEKLSVPNNSNDDTLFNHDGFRWMDSNRMSQREAALTKFRLKRKDRCYEKKVRYQSRKKLAEQRPRVKGQFVRQIQSTDTVSGVDG